MTTLSTPISDSPMTARLGYLAELQKAEEAYAEAWWTRSRPKRRSSGQRSPLRGSFSSDEAPSLDSSSELPSPSSSFPSTPAEYVQEYFETTRKNREIYNKAWSTAVERHILSVHDPQDPAIKLNSRSRRDPAIKLNSRSRRSHLLAAQLDAFAKREETRQDYYDAWSSPTIGDALLVHEPRDPATKIASASTDINLLAVQLQANAEERDREDAYDGEWINASSQGSLRAGKSRKSATKIASETKVGSLRAGKSRKSATKIASETKVTNTLAAQLRAVEDEALVEQGYVDAWSRYGEISRYAHSIDAWKFHHLERLRKESEYYNVWSDATKKSTLVKPKAPTKSKILISQIAMFQEIHIRDEQYNEAWTAYGQRHTAMAPAPVRMPHRRSRVSFSRSPRPAFMRRLPGDAPEVPMLGFSAIDSIENDDEYVKAWADKMKTTITTPANSLLVFSSQTRIIPSSPKPKKRSDKGHFKAC
ncbi:unnamed protein product [Rhizoctonia solani]|uniref:Uncharacterized protein n=1 Tax=Rhizoctonia solani TaxID=456999 RepID=A0A8H3B617_9AGAM|nr:unnamed protein product [Rhizoctonia solani]